MFIYYTVYTSNAKGSIVKRITCDKCDRDFAYRMKRQGEGKSVGLYGFNSARESERAERMATTQLDRRLRKEVDQVPCPHCGWYQDDMVEFVHKTKYLYVVYASWILVGLLTLGSPFLSLFLSVILGAVFGINANDFPFAGILTFLLILSSIGLAVATTYFRKPFAKRYNPNENESEEDRIERGRNWALSQKKFDQLFGEKTRATRNTTPANDYIKGSGHANDLEFEPKPGRPAKDGRDDDHYALKDQ